MVSQVQNLISEECWVTINHVASYELHISDAYLSMVSMGSSATVREVSALVWGMTYMYLVYP